MTQDIEKTERLDERTGTNKDWLELICGESADSAGLPINQPRTQPRESTSIGVLVGFDESGYPLVAVRDDLSPQPVRARSTIVLGRNDIDREVVLVVASGDVPTPI